MLLTGTSTETFTDSCCDLVSWETLKSHLRRNDDADKSLLLIYLCGAVSYCEQYLNRCLAYKVVKMYYQYECTKTYYDLQVRFPFDPSDTSGITVSVTDADGAETTVSVTQPIGTDIIRVYQEDLPDDWIMICVEYTPAVYELRNAVVPAILMKCGEIDTNREDGPTPKISSINSILNKHRVKRHA